MRIPMPNTGNKKLLISVQKFSSNLPLNFKMICNFRQFLQISQEKVRNLPSKGYCGEEPESDPSVSGQTGHQFDYRMMRI